MFGLGGRGGPLGAGDQAGVADGGDLLQEGQAIRVQDVVAGVACQGLGPERFGEVAGAAGAAGDEDAGLADAGDAMSQAGVAVAHQGRHVGAVGGEALDQQQGADAHGAVVGDADTDGRDVETDQAGLDHLAQARVGHVVQQDADPGIGQAGQGEMQHRQHLHQPVAVVHRAALLAQDQREVVHGGGAIRERRAHLGGSPVDLGGAVLGDARTVEAAVTVEHQAFAGDVDVVEEPDGHGSREKDRLPLGGAGSPDVGRDALGVDDVGSGGLEAGGRDPHHEGRIRRVEEVGPGHDGRRRRLPGRPDVGREVLTVDDTGMVAPEPGGMIRIRRVDAGRSGR